MSFTYDPATPLGTVRLLISDVDVGTPANQVFKDEELERLLALEGGDVRLGAALALETIASNEVQVLKVIKLLDLQTDGAKTAAELRAQARNLRDLVAAADDDFEFDYAEVVTNSFTLRQRLHNEILREG